MGQPHIIPFADDDQLVAAVAEHWFQMISAAQSARREHLVALSGGRVMKKLFSAVAAKSRGDARSLAGIHFFWADERCVPPDNPESNFRLADENLFRICDVKPAAVHRILGELPPEEAAHRACNDLIGAVGCSSGKIPALDLVLLGMGEDGHVASLFPGQVTAGDTRSIFLAVANSPKPPPNRVSLGHATIAAAREVWVLASGAGKLAALQESLSQSGRTPLATVIKNRPFTKIFTDLPTH